MAKKTKAQNKGQNQRASEAPVSEQFRKAAERIAYDPTHPVARDVIRRSEQDAETAVAS